jgi:hypothetical protein
MMATSKITTVWNVMIASEETATTISGEMKQKVLVLAVHVYITFSIILILFIT